MTVQIKHQVRGWPQNIISLKCWEIIFWGPPSAELFAMWSRMLPLISLEARAASSAPGPGCENWPGKINLSCLFSFCPLLIMAIIKIILLSVVFSGSCFGSSCSILIQLSDMQNVCEQKLNILFSNCRMREISNILFTCFLVLVLLVLNLMYLAISSLRPEISSTCQTWSHLNWYVALIQRNGGKMLFTDCIRPRRKFKTFQDDNFPLKWAILSWGPGGGGLVTTIMCLWPGTADQLAPWYKPLVASN